MSVITHEYHSAITEVPAHYAVKAKALPASTPLVKSRTVAAVVGRYVGAVVGGAALAALMVGPISSLPGSHGNVYSALTFLLALGWFVALNYIRKPLIAAGFTGLGVFGLVAASLSMASPAWLWAAWSVNALAGIAGLLFARHTVFVPGDRMAAWTAFHAGLMLVVASFA